MNPTETKLKDYVVLIQKTVTQPVHIIAKNEQDAKDRVFDGEGEYGMISLESSKDNDKSEWVVEEDNGQY